VTSEAWLPRVHVVSDDAVLARPDFVRVASALLDAFAGRIALHIRGPRTPGRVVYAATAELRRTQPQGVIVVNDRVDVALAVACGVHLGDRSLSPRTARALLGQRTRIGRSWHGDAQTLDELEHADYAFLGAVYPTASHPERSALSAQALGDFLRASPVPTVAIGGISEARIGVLLGAGAHGIAVLRAVWASRDPVNATGALLEATSAALRATSPLPSNPHPT